MTTTTTRPVLAVLFVGTQVDLRDVNPARTRRGQHALAEGDADVGLRVTPT